MTTATLQREMDVAPAQVPVLRAIGLMSGTSLDGVDLALVETDGAGTLRRGAASLRPYRHAERALLRAAIAEARQITDRHMRSGAVAEAEAMVTERHAAAVLTFLSDQRLTPSDVDVIGFHGQTLLHRPERRLTVQIGDGAMLADKTGIRVVHDFRAADVAAGGQGAPFVPVYHRALVAAAALKCPVALLNVGGVANLTFVGSAGAPPLACDTGPGNALIDDLMLARTGQPYDRDGATAGRGRADEAALADLMAHPFFALPPPKSLDRNTFSRAPVDRLALPDAAATLTAFTAAAVASMLPFLPAVPRRLIVCGGGARNPALMRELAARLPCRVTTAEAEGWSVDAMEAEAFGYLAVRSLRGLPLTFPTTTGVPRPITGGVLAEA